MRMLKKISNITKLISLFLVLSTHASAEKLVYSMGVVGAIGETFEIDGIKSRLGSGGFQINVGKSYDRFKISGGATYGELANFPISVDVLGENKIFEGKFKSASFQVSLGYDALSISGVPINLNLHYSNTNASGKKLKQVNGELTASAENNFRETQFVLSTEHIIARNTIKTKIGANVWSLSGFGTSFLTQTVKANKNIQGNGIDPLLGVQIYPSRRSNLPSFELLFKQFSISGTKRHLISVSAFYDF